ncbi:Ig-like domain-containing protein [Candidatus Pacearchaeota archaeon]|nr:Ig-like domain-containing protein [Candidatus Pacearchaeota archaeon]
MSITKLTGKKKSTFNGVLPILLVSIMLIASLIAPISAQGADTTNPTISITHPADGATLSGEDFVSADASDNVAITKVTFTLDGSQSVDDTEAPYSLPLFTTLMSDGAHNIVAVASDSSGNTASDSVSFTVNNSAGSGDTTAPSVSITSPANGASVSGTINVNADASDNVAVANVQFKVDGNNIGSADTSSPYSASLDTSTLSNGNHVLTAVAADSSGNTATSTSISITVNNGGGNVSDTTDPSVFVTNPTNGATVSGTIPITAIASDNTGVVGVTFVLDGNNAGAIDDTTAPYETSLDSTLVADGSHSISATARDSAGNTASHTIFFNVNNAGGSGDTTAPAVLITQPFNNSFIYGSSYEIQADASDNVAVTKVTFTLDGSQSVDDTTSPYGTIIQPSALSEGQHTLSATAFDAAGNTAVYSIVFNIDNDGSQGPPPIPAQTPPAVTIIDPQATTYTSYPIPFRFSINEAGDCSYLLDNNFSNQYPMTKTDASRTEFTAQRSDLANGNYHVAAICTDLVGNANFSEGRDFTVNVGSGGDTTNPSVSITSPSNGASVSGTINVNADASDNVAVANVQFKVDGNNIGSADTSSPYSASLDTSTLSNGNHVLTAVAADSSGNTATSASISITVNNGAGGDTTNPSVSITSPTNGATVSGTIAVSATASDNVGVTGVTFVLDGNTAGGIDDTAAPYETSLDSTLIADGTHTLSATARDAAGNTQTASVTFTVNNAGGGNATDTIAPAVSITSPSHWSTVSGTIAVSATASDNVGVTGVTFVLDGNNAGAIDDTTAPYGTSLDTTLITDGTHTLSAIARDAAGNTASDVINFIVNNAGGNATDTTPPAITVFSPENKTYNTSTIVVNFSASDSSGISSLSFMNDTGITEYTGATTQTASEGSHTWTFIARDNLGNEAHQNVTFAINLTAPGEETNETIPGNVTCSDTNMTISQYKFVYFVCPTLESGAVVDRNYIEVNTTTIPAGIGNITIRLYNASHQLISEDTAGTYYGLYKNYSGLPYGLYFYNASIDGENLNMSYFATETRNITLANLTIPGNGTIIPGNETNGTLNDTIPPAQVTDLHSVAVFENSITWAWNNPNNTDFAHTKVYLDGEWTAYTTQEIFTAGNLLPGTLHLIALRTVDTNGNVNTDTVFHIERTLGGDLFANLTIPSLSISGLNETIAYPIVTTFSGNGCPNENVTCRLYLDGILVSNPHTTILSPGEHTVIFLTNGDAQYAPALAVRDVTVIANSNSQFASGTTIVLTNGTKEVIFTDNSGTEQIIIRTTSDTEEIILNLALLLEDDSVTLPSNLTLIRESASKDYRVFIPAGTKMSAEGWDGTFIMPAVRDGSSFSVPSGTVDVVLTMGIDGELTFSQPVQVVLSGMAGKSAAWSSGSSTATPITAVCNSDSTPTNIDSVNIRECAVSSGSDLVIWTYHFTDFGAYTPASSSASSEDTSGSSDSSGSSGSGGRIVTSSAVTTSASDSTQTTPSESSTEGTSASDSSDSSDAGDSEEQRSPSITGAVTGTFGKIGATVAIVFMVLVILGLAIVSVRKLRKEK